MNFYDVLAAEKWGGGIPTTNFFDLLFAQSVSGEQWQTYEGTLPATINANGDDMRQYQVYGNTGGVGDRTENLYNPMAPDVEAGCYYDARNYRTTSVVHSESGFIPVTEGSYIFSLRKLKSGFRTFINFYDTSKNFVNNLKDVTNANGNYALNVSATGFIRFNAVATYADQYMLIEGATPPASFVPFGYEVDIGVKSGNIYNSAETSWSADGTVLNDSGEPISLEGSHYTTNFIPCEPAEVYYLAGSLANETRWRVYFYDANKNWIRRTGSKSPESTRLIEMNENARYFQLQVGTDIVSTSDWNFVHSLTAPTKYQPYYNITTPMYIGDEPLGEDEYIDYQTQKVYRMINGTLTPTDPPVPLPSLPTCEGETVIDYAGQGVAPEKVYFEYKGGTQS